MANFLFIFKNQKYRIAVANKTKQKEYVKLYAQLNLRYRTISYQIYIYKLHGFVFCRILY